MVYPRAERETSKGFGTVGLSAQIRLAHVPANAPGRGYGLQPRFH